MALTQITTGGIKDATITTADIAADAITNAKIANNAVTVDNLPTGTVNESILNISNTGSNGQFLQKQSGNTGGLTWATPTTISFSNDADNRIVTGTGSGLNGEANFTFDGNGCHITTATPFLHLKDSDTGADSYIDAASSSGDLYLKADDNSEAGSTKITFNVDGSEKLRIDSNGRLLLGTTTNGQSGEADALTVHQSGHTGITIRTGGTSNNTAIYFADGTSGDQNYRGTIQYEHSGDRLVFKTAASEKLRITSGGQVRLPINGQELAFGASQQFKMFWENSEERMYLQGDGAYGFAFRVNSGNRLEINKTTGDVTMQGSSGRNFIWYNSEASLYLTDNG